MFKESWDSFAKWYGKGMSVRTVTVQAFQDNLGRYAAEGCQEGNQIIVVDEEGEVLLVIGYGKVDAKQQRQEEEQFNQEMEAMMRQMTLEEIKTKPGAGWLEWWWLSSIHLSTYVNTWIGYCAGETQGISISIYHARVCTCRIRSLICYIRSWPGNKHGLFDHPLGVRLSLTCRINTIMSNL